MYRILILLFLITSNSIGTLYAQGSNEILCKIVELGTNYPVSYATIQFKDKGNGVIANIDGDFRIPIRYKTDNETLIISCIGYETKMVELSTLRDNTVNSIFLKPKIEALDSVIINANSGQTAMTAREIIRKAVQKIPVNYPNTPFSSVGYFRDYQLVNNAYYNLNEGILEMFDSGFGTNKLLYKQNQEILYAYKTNTKFARDSIWAKAYDGETKLIQNATISKAYKNELSILNIHDPIRNYNRSSFSFIYTFRDDFLRNHYFKKGRLLYLEDEPLYEIKFYANKSVTGAKHKGSGIIYISKENFAIHKLTYQVDDVFDASPLLTLTVEYKPLNGKMYLNYITFNNRFLLKDRKSFKILDTSFDPSENTFFINFNNEIDPASIKRKLNYRFRYKKTKLLVDQVSLEDENTIKVIMKNWSIPENFKLQKGGMDDFTFKVKNIIDISGRKLNKSNTFVVNQYREFFVQDVFVDKVISKQLIAIKKLDLMQFSEINESQDYSKYWINTPLITKGGKK